MTASFARSRWILLGGALLLMGTGWARETVDGLQESVIDLGDDSPAAKVVRDHLMETLAMVKPTTKGKPQVSTTKGGGYVLSGNLFKTGSCFGLFETDPNADEKSSTVGLAERADGKWLLRGLWKMPVVWLPKGVKWDGSGENVHYPVEPYHKPFELQDFSGDGVPEVLVAGEVDKYFKSTYLLKYAPKIHGLDLLEWTMNKPEQTGKYVLLYNNSGGRAIWEEWTFCQWVEGKLVERAMWHSEVPYTDPEQDFILAEATGKDGKVEKFRITSTDSENEGEHAYTITRDDQPFAKLAVVWRHSDMQNQDPRSDEFETAWLFEKLTGLSRKLCPDRRDLKKPGKFEALAIVRVTGNEEAKKRLAMEK